MKKTLIILLAAIMLMTAGCSGEKTEEETGVYKYGEKSETSAYHRAYSEDKPLFCLAESEEEARKTADEYGIELVEYNYGVASFYTDKDLRELIEWGKTQGLPLLEINYISTIN